MPRVPRYLKNIACLEYYRDLIATTGMKAFPHA